MILATLIVMIFAICSNFYLDFIAIDFSGYLYLLIALLIPFAFMIYPSTKAGMEKAPSWYDYLLAGLAFFSAFYFFINSEKILMLGWEVSAPVFPKILSLILLIAVIEAVRRSAGLAFTFVVTLFAVYPMFAGYMPSLLYGAQFDFWRVVSYHAMGPESIIGIPLATVGSILIGYLVFAVVLNHAKAGDFFLDASFALLGGFRGGAAKVAVISSALFGSISGSVISNVLTTGSFTIPAMKKTGYPPHYAGAVEACSSTGGVLAPPIMGVTAFIMAQFLGIPYFEVAMAAFVPSFLYYFALYVHIDCMAANMNLYGVAKEDRPEIKTVLKEGWFYIFGMLFLLFYIFVLRLEVQAPWVTAAIILAIAQMRIKSRMNIEKLAKMIEDIAKTLIEIVTLLAGVGLIIGAMAITGLGHSLARDIVGIAAGNTMLILFFGALASLILGMGMTMSACYIFLAIVMAPALVKVGFDPLAVHLYVLYWAMISFITPPVALGAYAASAIAGASPMKTGYTAMKIGSVIYLLPVFFVLNPALILHGKPLEVVYCIITALIGVFVFASATEGYILKLGKLPFWSRIVLAISGAMLAFPEVISDIVGALIIVMTLGALYFIQRKKQVKTSQN